MGLYDASVWRKEVLTLANSYYDIGHDFETKAATEPDTAKSSAVAAYRCVLWTKADCYRNAYHDLCALVRRVDPRPGAPEAPAKPW